MAILRRRQGTPSAPRTRAGVVVGVSCVAALAVALVAGIKVGAASRHDIDGAARAVAAATKGRYSPDGMAALVARMDEAQLALALRHDPAMAGPLALGLTPGWSQLMLGGRPDPFAIATGLAAMRLNAAQAADTDIAPATPFVFRPASQDDRRRALRCLTQAVYYEAALEPDAGQDAVAQVVLNRVRDPNYPSSICGVVYQGAERDTGCQFTFTCDGSLARPPVAWAWTRAQKVAERALAGHVAPHVGSATHYHADYVRPWWAPSLSKVAQSGAHIFYRWRGEAGSVAALSQPYSGTEPFIDEARFAQVRLPGLEILPETVQLAEEGEAPRHLLDPGNRIVEFEGTTRIVGAPSLGGRRQPSAEEIARINARLEAFEAGGAQAAQEAEPQP